MRLLIVIAALVASVSASAVFADTTPPELVSWDASPDEVDVTFGSRTVQVDFTFRDPSGVDTSFEVAAYVTVCQVASCGALRLDAHSVSITGSSNGATVNSTQTDVELTGRATFVVPKGAEPGGYAVQFDGLKDKRGNVYWSRWQWPLSSYEGAPWFNVERGPDPTLQMSIEEPVAGEVHMGVGNIRGWVVSSRGIERVRAYLNDKLVAEVPYGGSRADVASAFPDISSAASSGFSMSYNYSSLCEGRHTLEIVAETIDNDSISSAVEFQTIGLEQEFIASSEIIDLDTSAMTATGEEIEVRNISIAGKYYNAKLRWRTAEQGFEIVELEPLDSDGRACE
jgi:hypothetical protein